jgi:ribonuclease T2
MFFQLASVFLVGAAFSANAAVDTPRNGVNPLRLDLRDTTQCGTSGPASCQNTTVQTDLCCFESPGVRH